MRERREVVIIVVLADVGDGGRVSSDIIQGCLLYTVCSLFGKQGYEILVFPLTLFWTTLQSCNYLLAILCAFFVNMLVKTYEAQPILHFS